MELHFVGSSSKGNLPDALVIGPMRSATTWVHRYLKTREDVCLPTDVKETFFFDRRFEKGIKWYKKHFKECENNKLKITIEVGPSYFHSEEAPGKIRDILGQVPLVVIYRNPIERSFSHYAHLRRFGFTSLPLREAVEEFPEILTASRYAEQLKRWIRHFGRSSLEILRLETLKESPAQFAINLTRALCLPKKSIPEDLKTPVNQSTIPKSNVLAGITWRVADALRGWRLHKIVEWAKKIGVKDAVMESASGERPGMSESERAWLRKQLKDDTELFPEMIPRIEEEVK